MSRLNVTEKIITTRISRGLKWSDVADKVGLSKEWVTAACLGQMALSSDQAAVVGDIFGLTVDERQWLTVPPYRGSLPSSVPTDPLVYRFHPMRGKPRSSVRGRERARRRRAGLNEDTDNLHYGLHQNPAPAHQGQARHSADCDGASGQSGVQLLQ
ncbi:MAG: hypothetical protein KA752_08895, partial [Giesbergeria sp.]|nr:hypothetical protein [Giesbergeria sp.]